MSQIIIFVDDDKDILQGLKRSLRKKRSEWEIIYFDSSVEAAEYMKENDADVVVSDMKMPEMNGVQLMEKVKEYRPNSIRIILSGHMDDTYALHTFDYVHRFFSKPFKTQDMIVVIEEALLYKNIVRNPNLDKIVNSLSSMPILPNVYFKIVKDLEDDNNSFEDIADTVEKDISLTIDILKIVNSCFFGIARDVTSVREAIMYLGIEIVKDVVMLVSVFSSFDTNLIKELKLSYLWTHSIAVANIAKGIAVKEEMSDKEVEACFTSGLLHDIGRLILAINFPNDYKTLMGFNVPADSILELEKEVFGADHCMVGAYISSVWGLPIDIVTSVWQHHLNGERTPGKISQILCLADSLYHNINETNLTFVQNKVIGRFETMDMKHDLDTYIEICKEKMG